MLVVPNNIFLLVVIEPIISFFVNYTVSTSPTGWFLS